MHSRLATLFLVALAGAAAVMLSSGCTVTQSEWFENYASPASFYDRRTGLEIPEVLAIPFYRHVDGFVQGDYGSGTDMIVIEGPLMWSSGKACGFEEGKLIHVGTLFGSSVKGREPRGVLVYAAGYEPRHISSAD